MPDLPIDPGDILDEITFRSARGGKAGPALQVEIIRELTEADLEVLESPEPDKGTSPTSLLTIRSTHHQLAQCLARGDSNDDASRITGYSPTYISNLKRDPAFSELVSHYMSEREAIFADAVEQCRILGLSFKEELQKRLEESPAQFTAREIMEAMNLLLVQIPRPQTGGIGGASGGPAVNIQVSFDAPNPGRSASTDSPIVEVEFAEILEKE